MKLSIHIFAIAALGKGLSGSDRIFVEFAKRLKVANEVTIHVWEEGYRMYKSQGLESGVSFNVINLNPWCKFGFWVCYFARIVNAVVFALFARIENNGNTVIFSASEFWMDSFPAFVLKIRFPKARWVAGWFQTAPNPLVGFSLGNREKTYKLSAFYHWFMQLPVKPLIEKWADLVLVNNEEERKYFPSLNKQGKTIVILGAVNIEGIKAWRSQNKKESLSKTYEAVFQGRFHPQKGVLELVDIWKKVTKKLPKAKLAMIGDGPLMDKVKNRIKQLRLDKNIYLFGYVFDGDQKYKIFSQSKIVLHPAFFDSGGMASAEAMVFGLPCVGFNLPSYKSYYPKGMVKVEVGNLLKFEEAILELLENKNKRERIGDDAQEMINKNWSWDQRVSQLLIAISKNSV